MLKKTLNLKNEQLLINDTHNEALKKIKLFSQTKTFYVRIL